MTTLNRDGIELHYSVNSGNDQAFVFVHGWSCNGSYFKPQAEHFASQGHTVVTLDLRGHGLSVVPEGTPITIANFADDVSAIISAAGVRKPIVVGHSMGGIIALNLAVEHTENVGGIVMVDPAPLVWGEEFAAALDGVVDAMKAGDQEPRRGLISEGLFLPTDDESIKARVVEAMMNTPAHVAIAAMESIRAFDGPGMASRCKVPALHIGAAMPLNPLVQLEELVEGAVSGQTVGAGHFNQLLVPVQVNDMIEQFARQNVWNG